MKSQNFLSDFQTQMAKDFELQDPELFDTVFEIEGKKLYAHKYRLTAMSTTFKVMLSDRWTTKDEPIEIKSCSFEIFKEFLRFFYSGEYNATDENIFAMLDLAEFYHINHLKELCDEYLSKTNIDFGNIFTMIELSNKYALDQIKTPIHFFISMHFLDFIKLEKFLDLEKTFIEEFITMIARYCIKPEELFEAVYDWSEYQATKKQKETNAENFNKNDAIKTIISPFLPYIKFKEMQQSFLNRHVVKRGFLFSYDELSDILDSTNPVVKVKVTNLIGQTIYGNLPNEKEMIKVIKSLKNRYPDNTDINRISWDTKYAVPKSSNPLKKKEGIRWYLFCSVNGKIGIKHSSRIYHCDRLLAEMYLEDEVFSVGSKCRIEIL